MKTLTVKIGDGTAGDGQCAEYSTPVPEGLSDDTYRLIALGLLFDNDWSADGTWSRWEVK